MNSKLKSEQLIAGFRLDAAKHFKDRVSYPAMEREEFMRNYIADGLLEAYRMGQESCLCESCAGRTRYERGGGVVLFKRGLVAVSRRLDHSKKLQFPGGHIESGETCVLGTLRELREETGLVIEPRRLEHLFHAFDAKGYTGREYKGCYFWVELKQSEEPAHTEPKKSSRWDWVRLCDIDPAEVIPSTARAMDAFAKVLRQ